MGTTGLSATQNPGCYLGLRSGTRFGVLEVAMASPYSGLHIGSQGLPRTNADVFLSDDGEGALQSTFVTFHRNGDHPDTV